MIETAFNNLLTRVNLKQILTLIMERGFYLLLLLIGFVIAKHLSHLIFKKYIENATFLGKKNNSRQRTLIKLFYNLLDYTLYFLLGYWSLSIVGIPVGSLLAGAGIAGVAIGLGAKDFFTDLVNGIFILIERQYDIGEHVKLEKVEGTVTKIGIRTTQIRDLDGSLHFVPNRYITIVTNQSRGDMRIKLDIPIYAGSPVADIDAVIQAASRNLQERFPILVKPPQVAGPTQTNQGQFVFRIYAYVENGTEKSGYHTLYQHYHDALVAAGIPLPTLDSPILTSGK